MGNVFLLGANKTIDTHKQVVEVNQVIQMEGYSYDKYVVYDTYKNDWGYYYKVINIRTKVFQTVDLIRPLREKFGIGYYYDDENPTFMDTFEVALLRQEAEALTKAKKEEEDKERIRVEQMKAIGRKRFTEVFPEDAKAVIVALLKQDDSDIQTDYFASSTKRTVILGFSTHTRDIFSEMRKYASNFGETVYLTEKYEKYEHREKYSMGSGYYLGESKYHGWIIKKIPVYDRNRTIEDFSYTAGNEDNMHIKQVIEEAKNTPVTEQDLITGNYTLIEYSEKSVAVFGDTKQIKDQLHTLGGKFNKYLKYMGKVTPGWIFPKSKEEQLSYLFGLN